MKKLLSLFVCSVTLGTGVSARQAMDRKAQYNLEKAGSGREYGAFYFTLLE